MTNGDVLSDIDVGALLGEHRERGASLTIATMVQKLRIESGVLTTDASLRVAGIVEKPTVEHRINLGVYVLAEHLAELIAPNERLEMPQLAEQLISRGEPVIAYDHRGRWPDIGSPEDFAKAQADAATWWERPTRRQRGGHELGAATDQLYGQPRVPSLTLATSNE